MTHRFAGSFGLIFFAVALGACSSAGAGSGVPPDGGPADAPAAVAESCSFRVTGATIDKITESHTVASMDGSTLAINCQVRNASSTRLVLSAKFKAFDGAGPYTLDGTDKLGELTYFGNDQTSYFASSFASGAGTPVHCAFTFDEAPKDPKPSDALKASFHCEGLQGFAPGKPVDDNNLGRVDVVDGTFQGKVR